MDPRVNKIIALIRLDLDQQKLELDLIRADHNEKKHRSGCRCQALIDVQQKHVDLVTAGLAELES